MYYILGEFLKNYMSDFSDKMGEFIKLTTAKGIAIKFQY